MLVTFVEQQLIRCDACSARSVVELTWSSARGEHTLSFCGHHYREHCDALIGESAEEEWVNVDGSDYFG